MASRQNVEITGSPEISEPIVIDLSRAYFNLGVQLDFDGALTVAVEQTLDEPSDPQALWTSVLGLGSVSSDLAVTIFALVAGVRLNSSAGAGSCRLTVVQPGARQLLGVG